MRPADQGRTTGSIPACAGEPTNRTTTTLRTRVYPRVCGGTASPVGIRTIVTGLSPRVRGNRPYYNSEDDARGSIPACAGEPGVQVGVATVGGVYPRVCGGTCTGPSRARRAGGLSPRVRGNHPTLLGSGTLRRSIPACAGEPTSLPTFRACLWVYPRVCGGTTTAPAPRLHSPGLSPRVRGNRRPLSLPRPPERSIPACAGEPPLPAFTTRARNVYPRVCGGTSKRSFFVATSPRGMA